MIEPNAETTPTVITIPATAIVYDHFGAYSPDGHLKFPHLWPPQIPPGKTAGL